MNETDPISERRRKKQADGRLSLLRSLAIAGAVAWGFVLVVSAAGLLLFVASFINGSRGENAANGISFLTVFVGLYVVARGVEKVTVSVARITAPPNSR